MQVSFFASKAATNMQKEKKNLSVSSRGKFL